MKFHILSFIIPLLLGGLTFNSYADDISVDSQASSVQDERSTRKKDSSKSNKVDICHIPSGNPSAAHTINISMKTYENAH